MNISDYRALPVITPEILLRTVVMVELSTETRMAETDSSPEAGRHQPQPMETVVLTVYVPHSRLHPTRVQIVEI